MGRGLLGLRMAVVRMRSCQGSAGCGCRYRSHDSTSYEVGGPKPPAAEARSFSKHACPAGFSPSIVSHAVRQPVAAAWQRAAPRRRLDAPPLGCGLVRGSDGTAIGGPFTVASGRADSTSQTSAARSRRLAEGCFSRLLVASPSARLRACKGGGDGAAISGLSTAVLARATHRTRVRRAAASPREGPQLLRVRALRKLRPGHRSVRGGENPASHRTKSPPAAVVGKRPSCCLTAN